MVALSVLVTPEALPRFWHFMYRATPVTYFVNAIVSTGLAGVPIECSARETFSFDPPPGQSCAFYLRDYIMQSGGILLNPAATRHCNFCPVSSTDAVIARFGIFYHDRWRDFGITLAYSTFNVLSALALYWLFRVPKAARRMS